jgi:adenylosuccinate lyase
VRADLRKSAILKGAVGNYLGLGDDAIAVEKDYAAFLGLDVPFPDDWHASRDVFADYATTLAKISKSYGRWGQTIFLMQSNDLGEVLERRPATAVSSSSMPHKNNPSRSEALIHYSRIVPALAEVILADMVNFYERDNTSRPNDTLAELSRTAEQMMADTGTLLQRLEVKPSAMLANLNRTGGLITAQRVLQALIPKLGKQQASDIIYSLAKQAYSSGQTFAEALSADKQVTQHLSAKEIASLTDTASYLGLDALQVDAVINYVETLRKTDPRTE